jgi:Golgi apparatus protein 1
MFCQHVPPGDANVITCLQHASLKPHFPHKCREVMDNMLARASTRFSLNVRLASACMPGEAHHHPIIFHPNSPQF